MDFRTSIIPDKPEFNIDYQSKLMLFGSCFAENIGAKLSYSNFDVNVNPFGILYNPASISKVLHLLLDKKVFTEKDIFKHRDIYYSFYHHGDFSSTDEADCLRKIQDSMEQASSDLLDRDILLITFGTAHIFNFRETDEIVSNCHKLPASLFSRKRLTVDEIVDEWSILIKKLREVNPQLKLLFTVSPVRHWKDGAHGNQLSKSILLLAIDKLQAQYAGVFYFPAYELVLDDLRDYRFYEQDMLHPNNIAIDYIWEHFENTYFDNKTRDIIKEWEGIKRAVNHRPFNEHSTDHQSFLRQTLQKITKIEQKYPFLRCKEIKQDVEKRLI